MLGSLSLQCALLSFLVIFLDVYVAAALMEYFCSKDRKIASNIFELAFKKYKNDAKFVSYYLDFLIHLNGQFIDGFYLVVFLTDVF